MFIVDEDHNEAISLAKTSFYDVNKKEKAHLQEWIAKNPVILGEELLIIQKEFQGFIDTKERLDLLALDKKGNLVIIENKIDDSGKDVTWQALKYVSYCSNLGHGDIKSIYQDYLNHINETDKSAEDRITEFLGCSDFEEAKLNDGDQRIILVAANFRKEVTSTIMWLLNHNIQIICVRVTLYKKDLQIFLSAERILPPPNTDDYWIGAIKKQIEDKKQIGVIAAMDENRIAFWTRAIPTFSKYTGLYQNVSPSKDNWISGASGYGGIGFNCVITKQSARVELYISKGNQEENKRIYDALLAQKSKIEESYGEKLTWDRLDDRIASRVSHSLNDVSLLDEGDWNKMIDFLGVHIHKLQETFSQVLKTVVKG